MGKSDLAIALARRIGGEVVNTDAMQLYRGMDVGTAKVRPAERDGVPHHLLDVLDVTEPASVAEFQRWARDVIGGCRLRGVVPVLVGGSALYTRAVLDRFEFPGPIRRSARPTSGSWREPVPSSSIGSWRTATPRLRRASSPPTVAGSCGRWR